MSFQHFSDAEWDNAEVREDAISQSRDFTPVPDGEYVFLVSGVKEKTAKTGTPYIELELTIADGEYASRKEWKKYFKLQFLKEDLLRMGASPSSFWDDPESILERMFLARKKNVTRNGYAESQVWINGPVDPNADRETRDYGDLSSSVKSTFPEATAQDHEPQF